MERERAPSDSPGLARCLVGERDGFEILDPRVVAVTRADTFAPGPRIERLGGRLAFPHVDPAGDVAFLPADELLAQEARRFQKVGRNFSEMFAAFLKPDRFRQS